MSLERVIAMRPNTHIAAGDDVIIHDETIPHRLWKLGQIQEVIPGADGLPLA